MKVEKLSTLLKTIALSMGVFLSLNTQAQVTIGSHYTPKTGALLDLKQTDELGNNSTKGLMLPRIALQKLSLIDPITVESSQPTELAKYLGLVVYNVTDDFSESLCPGIYVWNHEWSRLNPMACERIVPPELINTANCFMAMPSGVVEDIHIGKAFLVWEKYQWGEIANDVKISTDLLWQDAQGLVEKAEIVDPAAQDAEKKIRVTLKPGDVAGNALVVVRMGTNGNTSDPIYWSWHIWVANHDVSLPSELLKHNNGEKEYSFMIRNLGATHPFDAWSQDASWMGLQYQWGRKDPFSASTNFKVAGHRKLYDINDVELTEMNELGAGNPVGTGFKHMEAVDLNNLKNSVLNPSTFYYGPYSSDGFMAAFDWQTTDETGAHSNNNLWDATDGKKTEFDPCPSGWRVPVRSANLSPWEKYKGGGWGGGGNAHLMFDENGVYLTDTALPGEEFDGLGFYPFGSPRLGRVSKGSGPVGSNPPDYAGGLFRPLSSGGSPPGIGYYWTATAITAPGKVANAHANYITTASMGIDESFNPVYASRAISAFVRCVQD